MIPKVESDLLSFEFYEEPNKTYRLYPQQKIINGHVDNLESIEQAVYCILNTERFKYSIYSDAYGIELEDLYGEPISYVCPELQRRITEALTRDERITSVEGFSFSHEKNTVKVSFTVHTGFGDITAERTVNV